MIKGLRPTGIDWTRKPGPGKFEGNHDARLAQVLYGYSMDSSDVEEIVSDDSFNNPDLFMGIIRSKVRTYYIEEDSQGFFTYIDITENS